VQSETGGDRNEVVGEAAGALVGRSVWRCVGGDDGSSTGRLSNSRKQNGRMDD
jgi:hypothetical protein